MFEQINPAWMVALERGTQVRYRCDACGNTRTRNDHPRQCPRRIPCGHCAARHVVKHAEQELLAAWKEAHPNNDEHNEIVESVTKEAARRSFLFPHEVYRGKELARLVDAVAESDSGARTKALEQLAGFVLAWRIAEVPHV